MAFFNDPNYPNYPREGSARPFSQIRWDTAAHGAVGGMFDGAVSGLHTTASSPLEYGGRDITAQLLNDSMHQLAPGTLVLGRFYIEQVLGRGGMSNVYLCRDQHFEQSNNQRSLKEMIARVDFDTSLSNFKREANVLAGLRHPRIPRVYDYFTIYRRAYLVLDFIEGNDLGSVLNASVGMLPPVEVVDWMLQLCDIVEYLHMQPTPIVFRDFKPSNIIRTPDGHIVLIDFGIAKLMQQGTAGDTIVGTKGYAAREMYRGHAEPRSDIYSLGAMMHHLLTREDPSARDPFTFHEFPIRHYNPAVSPQLEAVVMRCVEQSIEKRYQNIGQLRRAIEEAVGYSARRIDYGSTVEPGTSPNINLKMPPPRRVQTFTTTAVWCYQTENEIRATPAIGNDTIFVGSYDNNLHAVDLLTGRLRWKFPTLGGVCVTPALWHDRVFIGSQDFNIYSINAATGQENWRYRTWQRVHSSPRIYENRLYIGSDDMFVHAIEPQEGLMLWREQTFREVWSSAAYDNGVIIIGSNDGSVYAFDALTGSHKWRFRTQADVASTPCVADGNVYFSSYDFAIYAVEVKSGYQAWRTATAGFVISSPLVVKDRLYVGSTDKSLYCLDLRSGDELWKYPTNGQVNSTPAYADDALFFGSNDGTVYSLDMEGNLRWRYPTGGIIPGSPVVHNGIVYIGSADGFLYALRADGDD